MGNVYSVPASSRSHADLKPSCRWPAPRSTASFRRRRPRCSTWDLRSASTVPERRRPSIACSCGNPWCGSLRWWGRGLQYPCNPRQDPKSISTTMSQANELVKEVLIGISVGQTASQASILPALLAHTYRAQRTRARTDLQVSLTMLRRPPNAGLKRFADDCSHAAGDLVLHSPQRPNVAHRPGRTESSCTSPLPAAAAPTTSSAARVKAPQTVGGTPRSTAARGALSGSWCPSR